MDIIEEIKSYKPINEQEKKDKELILFQLENNPDVLERKSTACHVTVSAWVINEQHNKVLMAYHNIYNSWAWLGGHADGNSDLPAVAIKEATEESGITNVHLIPEIASLEVLTVDGHIKRGEYVSSHLHLNISYILIANEAQTLTIKQDENSNVAWLSFDEVFEKSNEEWFKANIYPKLIEKSRVIK